MRKAAIALAALALCVPPLRGQVPEGAPLTYDNVLYTTPVWSREDPFALLYLASRTNYIESVAALGPRVTALEGGTNNWNTAYGWGNHAGLYRAIGWVPSWTEVTGKPATFPPETHQHDHTSITNPPWLTDIPPLDAVLAAGNVTGGSIAITNTAGMGFSTELHNSGLFLKVNGNTVLDVGVGGTGGIWANPWGGIYLGDNPVVYGISVNGGEALHGDVAITIPNEQDLAALRTYHYGSPDIVESPEAWFTFDANTGTITGYNYEEGREAVVIPWQIGGVAVTAVGDSAFSPDFSGLPVTSVAIPDSVTSIGEGAFYECSSLTSVNIPSGVTSIGSYAFYECSSLTSVNIPSGVTSIGEAAFVVCSSLTSVNIPSGVTSIGDAAFAECSSLTSVNFSGNAPTAGGENIFYILAPNQVTNYVTNPQATGWGEKWGDMPVVRLPLYADAIYQAGELVATTGHVAEAIAGKVDTDGGTATNLWLQGETIVSDSYTNLWWRNVYSNGWHWLVAYTNAPGGAE